MGVLEPQRITEFTVNFLFAIAFIILYRRDRRQYLFYWALALCALVAQNFINILPSFGMSSLASLVLGRLLNLAAAMLSIWGAHAFFGDEPSFFWIPIVLATFFWSLLSQGLPVGFLAGALPVYLVISALLAMTAQKVAESKHPGIGHLLTSAGFTIFSIYAFTFPWLSKEVWFRKVESQLDLFFSIVTIVGILTLHNELARAEAEESAKRYQSVFANAINGIFVANGDGRIIAANRSLANILGYERVEDLYDKKVEGVFKPEKGVDTIYNIVNAKNVALCTESADGKVLELSVNLSRHYDEKGALIRIEGSVQDMTKENALRQQLMQAQRLDSMGRVAGGMAHDFNNLLTAIHGNVQLVLLHESLEKEAILRLGDTLKAVECAREMTTQLLSFARYEPLVTKVVEVNSVVESLVELLRRTLPSKVVLNSQITDEKLLLRAGETQVEQIVMNLLLNSRDAVSFDGEISLNLQCDEKHIIISVTDTGEGIAAEDLPHIFEPFYTTKSPEEGTGLGLASVYGVVQQLGGTIEVKSKPEDGSTFTVSLPRCSEVSKTEEEMVKKTPVASSPLTVLLVEDREMVRKVAYQMCESLGYRVIEARSGSEALEFAAKQSFDIILTDVVMPKMSGPTLVSKLLSEKGNLPCVFLSAYAPHPETWPSGCTFLRKPFSVNELKDAIERALSNPAR